MNQSQREDSLKKTMVFCDNPGCNAKTETNDPTWYLLSLHQQGHKSEPVEQEDWTVRDLCPACGSRFESGLQGKLQIIFRRKRVTGVAEAVDAPADASETVGFGPSDATPATPAS